MDLPGWGNWWPGLEKGEITESRVEIVGTKLNAVWKSMFGYQLKMQLTITGYIPNQKITFQSEGDLIGSGSWAFTSEANGWTRMDIAWNVATQKMWMNALAIFLRPVFIYAHERLMQKGEAGLVRYLRDKD